MIRQDITIEEYHRSFREYFSSSRLKPAMKSMRHFYYEEHKEREEEYKSHFDFGNACELAILDPEEFDRKVAIFQDHSLIEELKDQYKNPRASKIYREQKESFVHHAKERDMYVINDRGPESFEMIEHILHSAYQDKTIQGLIKNVESQYSLFWEHESGMKLKTRPDICKVNKNTIVDVKTTNDASPKEFSRSCRKFNYYFQAVMQIEGVLATGLMEKVDSYFYLVIEKSAPFNVVLYRLDDTMIKDLRYDFNLFVSRVQENIENENWVGYEEHADNKYGVLDLNDPYYKIINY